MQTIENLHVGHRLSHYIRNLKELTISHDCFTAPFNHTRALQVNIQPKVKFFTPVNNHIGFQKHKRSVVQSKHHVRAP